MPNYAAIGIGGKKNTNGSISIKAAIRRLSDGKDVQITEVTGVDLPDCRLQLEAVCNTLADNDNDQALSLAVVGRVLANSK